MHPQLLFSSELEPDLLWASDFSISSPNKEVSLDWVLTTSKGGARVWFWGPGKCEVFPGAGRVGQSRAGQGRAGRAQPGSRTGWVTLSMTVLMSHSCLRVVWWFTSHKTPEKKCNIYSSQLRDFLKFALKVWYFEVGWNHLQNERNLTFAFKLTWFYFTAVTKRDALFSDI